jgi:hypothetical protein
MGHGRRPRPDPDGLALLLARAHEEYSGAVFPTSINEESGRIENYPAWCGVLLDRATVARAGVPRAELFWWVEDTEYFHHRLPRVGVVALRADADVVRHRPVWRGAGRQPWKTYCEVRNTVYYRTGVQDPTPQRLLSLASSVTPLLGDAVLRSPRRSKLRMFAWGLSDGARGRLGKRVDPVAPRGRHAAGSPAPPLGGSLS